MQWNALCLETLLAVCHLPFKPEGSLSFSSVAGSDNVNPKSEFKLGTEVFINRPEQWLLM